MRYEILTDNSEMLTLVINSRIIAISHSETEIFKLISEYRTYEVERKQMPRNEVIIFPELDNNRYKNEKELKPGKLFEV